MNDDHPLAEVLRKVNEELVDPIEYPVVKKAVEEAFRLGRAQTIDSLPEHAHPPIDRFFGLTYTEYLVVPRTVLQSMPVEWQQRMLEILRELDDTIDWRLEGNYYVLAKNLRGKLMKDPFQDFDDGRRRLPLRARLERSTGSKVDTRGAARNALGTEP